MAADDSGGGTDDLGAGQTVRGFVGGQRLFGRYRLERILGRGGMGVVWLAFDEELERRVALKFLPEVVILDREAIADLKRETRRSLEITHPNIVRIYDFEHDAQAGAISMEYVDGPTLSALKVDRKGCVSPDELRPMLVQLCGALDYAHQRAKVVHRDLKPANLMLARDGELKVADFGIACSISDSVSRVSKDRGTSGTVLFMSPQQAMGERPCVADDIYALGATLFDLLSGKPPFHRGDILAQVRASEPPRMAAQREELGLKGEPIPEAWEQTVRACLAKDPALRPKTAGEVLSRLNSVAKPQQGPAARQAAPHVPAKEDRPAPSSGRLDDAAGERNEPAARPGSRAPLLPVMLAFLLLGGAGAAGWWHFFGGPSAAERMAEVERRAQERMRTPQEPSQPPAQKLPDRPAPQAAEADLPRGPDPETVRLRAEVEAAKARAAEADRQRMAAEADRERMARDQAARAEAARQQAARDAALQTPMGALNEANVANFVLRHLQALADHDWETMMSAYAERVDFHDVSRTASQRDILEDRMKLLSKWAVLRYNIPGGISVRIENGIAHVQFDWQFQWITADGSKSSSGVARDFWQIGVINGQMKILSEKESVQR